MFADRILETSGVQRSNRSLSTLTSFALQAGIAAVLLLFPLFHSEGLPLLHHLSTPVSLGARFPQPLAMHASGGRPSIFTSSAAVYPLKVPSHMPTGPAQASQDPGVPVGWSGPYTGPGDPAGAINVFGTGTMPVIPPPPTQPVAVRVRISHMDVGSLIHTVQPVYPGPAKMVRIQGAVVMTAIIGKDGTIQNLHVLSGHPLLTNAAIEAVRQWRYRPYILNNEPVEVETQITVNFSLSAG